MQFACLLYSCFLFISIFSFLHDTVTIIRCIYLLIITWVVLNATFKGVT